MTQYRTIIDKEVGSIFQNPNGVFPYTDYGAFVGSAPTGSLDPACVYVIYGQLDKFAPSQDNAVRGFPYSKLKATLPQDFITSGGKPVYYGQSLAVNTKGVPTTAPANWQQAIFISDPAYVQFYINEYLIPILGSSPWVEADEGSYAYDLFGIINQYGVYVPNVTWDEPFPQNDTAYLNMVASFFEQYANTTAGNKSPILPDLGSISQPALFPTVFSNVRGILFEDLYAWASDPADNSRNTYFAQAFTNLPWYSTTPVPGINIMRALLPAGDPNALLTSFCMYSLLKTLNSFFAPGNQGAVNTNPALWAPWAASLGLPTTAMTYGSATSLGAGYRLYQRTFNGGIAYLNWTGAPVTVNLAGTYYTPTGAAVTSITIPDGIGTFVSFENGNLPMPEISPRATHTAVCTITTSVAGATIRYTLDGSTPTGTSPIYTGPIAITHPVVVSACTFLAGSNPSWASVANYPEG
jgi:hypothetical protein